MNNSIDLASIYGIGASGCPASGCVPTGQIVPGIPSLEQIAAYNLSRQRSLAGNAGNMTQPGQGTAPVRLTAENMNLTTTPATSLMNNNNTTVETPATSLMNSTTTEGQEILNYSEPFAVTSESIQFLNGFLRTQVGRNVEIDFLIGTDAIETKKGILLGVGANYIIMSEAGTNNLTVGDFYNIKFVKLFYSPEEVTNPGI